MSKPVVGQRVEDVVGHRDRLLLAGQLDLGVRAAAVVERHHAAVVVGVAVGADAERAGQVAGQAHEEAARPAGLGSALGERRLGTAVAGVPALGRHVDALRGEGADPAEAEVLGDLAHLRLGVGVERVVAEGVGRHQARVLVLDGEQVAGREVAGLEPLLVGDPRRRHDRVGAGDEHDLVDGGLAAVRGTGQRHRPAPAGVAGARAGEQVGDDELTLALGTEVLTDVGGVRQVEDHGAREVGGRGQGGVGRGLGEGDHCRIMANPGRPVSSTCPPGSSCAPRDHPHGRIEPMTADHAAPPRRDRVGRASGAPDAGCGPPVAGWAVGSPGPPGRPAGRAASPCSRPGAPPAPRAPATPASPASSGCTPSTPRATPRSRSRWPARCSSRCPPARHAARSRSSSGSRCCPSPSSRPLIGPFLDRFSHGRRWAIGSTMAVRAFLCWVAGDGGRHRLPVAVPGGPRRAGRVQGVRRDAGRRRPPPAPARPDPGQGQRPGLAGRRRRRRPSRRRSRCWPPRPGRSGRCATRSCSSCWPRSGRSGSPSGSTPAPARSTLVLMPGPSAGPRTTGRGRPDARCGGLRPQGQLRAALADRVPHRCSWRSCCATTRSATGGRRCCSGLVIGAAGLGNTLGIALGSLLRRIDPALTVVLALVADAVAVLVAALFYGLLPLVAAGPHGRARPVAGQAVARLDHPARRARADPGQRVRALGHHPAAGVGDRRLRRHRHAADAAAWGWASPAACSVPWGVVRARSRRPARRRARRPAGCLRQAGYSSSSSASARSSLAVGRAVLASGCRPWR